MSIGGAFVVQTQAAHFLVAYVAVVEAGFTAELFTAWALLGYHYFHEVLVRVNFLHKGNVVASID